MRHVDLRPAVVGLLLLMAGCLAAPPIRASGAVGVSAGNVPSYNRADTLHVEGSATGSNARVLATPLSTTRDPLARTWDVGLGWDTSRGQGYGGSIGFLVESVMEASHTGAMSASRGELAIGVSARGGVRHIDGETHAVVLFAVEVRFPGFLGVHLPVFERRASSGVPR